MELITGTTQHYAWGDTQAIPRLQGIPPTGRPVAEVWFGAHPLGPAYLSNGSTLTEYIANDPENVLGHEVNFQFNGTLPFLLKILAPAHPLSMQVHPSLEQAQAGWEREEACGIPRDDPQRSFRDRNHKPEMVYALTRFEALSGFRTPRRAHEIVDRLPCLLGATLAHIMESTHGSAALEKACRFLVHPATRPHPDEVKEAVAACEDRLAAGASPSVRADRIASQLGKEYPGDPGALVALLLNPVTLHPGEVLYTPQGTLHAYLRGVGVEIMADSDNVVRIGLTPKYVDAEQGLQLLSYTGAPPVRIAPEQLGDHVRVFYAPVDDFELTATTLEPADEWIPIPGRGPRILLCVEGAATVRSAHQMLDIARGHAVFIGANDGDVSVRGDGQLIQADVP